MSVEENKEKVRHWFTEVVNGKTDLDTFYAELDATISRKFVDHDMPNSEQGYANLKSLLPGIFHAAPDVHFTVLQLIGEADYVAVRVQGEATHTGEFMGKPATGKKITWTENEIYRFEDGKIVESWGEGTLEDALASIGIHLKSNDN